LHVLERARRRLAAQGKAGVPLAGTPVGRAMTAFKKTAPKYAPAAPTAPEVSRPPPAVEEPPKLQRRAFMLLPEIDGDDPMGDTEDESSTCASTLASLCDVRPYEEKKTDRLRRLLDRVKRAESFVLEEAAAPKIMHLHAGGHQIPHPRKVHKGGEDSYFSSEFGLGVADGVGEWEPRFGVNPRAFADQLMLGAKEVLEGAMGDNASLAGLPAPSLALEAVDRGYRTTTAWGSATCCVAALAASDRVLGIANLGDAGARVVRFGSNGAPTVVERTVEQQHSFNCPLQLTRLPPRAEWNSCRARGFGELIAAIEGGTHQDLPSSSALYSFDVQEGDLVLLGSDGLWDNLFEEELLEVLEQTVYAQFTLMDASRAEEEDAYLSRIGVAARRAPRQRALMVDPADVAAAIAQKTFSRSLTVGGRTPFADNAERAGSFYRGGKPDDITVVAAWVTRQ